MNFSKLVQQLLNESTNMIYGYKLVVIHSNPKGHYNYCDITPMVGYNIQEALYHSLIKYYRSLRGKENAVNLNMINYIRGVVKRMNVNDSGDFGELDTTRNNQVEFIISDQNVHYKNVEEYINNPYIQKIFCEPNLRVDIIELFDHAALNKELAYKPNAIFSRDFLDEL